MIEIRAFDEDDLMLHEMAKLNCSVFKGSNYSSADLAEMVQTIRKHSTYPGFFGIKALNDDTELIGFAYGYESTPGQFYRGKLEEQLTTAQVESWLADCFEFVELIVAPSARKRGVGSELHDALIGQASHRTSVLTTGINNSPAIRLYTKKEWEVIKHDAPVLSDDNLQLIMVKKCR
ncbi:GNAT family N-acetyltransferase [Virgibacillus siamensis]|uniref:GNAT family N-acetyltransferase n=1 Tax=Virgibacillus siamensis TaxID=480071 RepID=A0ABN1G3N5_9BACI